MPELIVFVISIVAVVVGADWLGNAATHIARGFSLPRVLIGATIVSLATTLPEIVIAAVSGIEGSPAIGLGTVFGSPIANIGLIFGILLFFSKASIEKAYFFRTIQFFLIVLALVFIFSLGGHITPISSMVLIIFGIIYLLFQLVIGKQEESLLERVESRFESMRKFFLDRSNYHQIGYLVFGGFLLLVGAHFLVNSAVTLASFLGIPSLVIGLVIIAFGTSIPELFTTINSIIRDRSSLSAGNLFGASVLDLSFALGLAGIFDGVRIPTADLYVTIGTLAALSSVSLLYIFGKVPPKILGLLLIGTYLVFLIWIALMGT